MSPDKDLAEQVRRRAYELWEAEGGGHGRDLAHWLQAERELAGQAGDVAPGRPRRRRATAAKGAAKAATPARKRRTPKPDRTT